MKKIIVALLVMLPAIAFAVGAKPVGTGVTIKQGSTAPAPSGVDRVWVKSSNDHLYFTDSLNVDHDLFSAITGGYATVWQTGAPLTNRSILNFSASFNCVDNPSFSSTDCDLAAYGAGAGTTSNLRSITVDAHGRVQSTTSTSYENFPALSSAATPSGGANLYFNTTDGKFHFVNSSSVDVVVGAISGVAAGSSQVTVSTTAGVATVDVVGANITGITETHVTNLVSDLAGKQATGNYITAITGDGSATGPGSAPFTLASIISAGSGGDASHTVALAYDAKGRLTAVTPTAIAIASTAVSGLGTLAGLNAASLTSNVTGILPVANGGTGANTLASGGVLVGAGTSSPTAVTCSNTGYALTWNGSAWACAAVASSLTFTGDVTGSGSSSIALTVAKVAGVAVTGDFATQYFINSGRSGGQTAYGGSTFNDRMHLEATSFGTVASLSNAFIEIGDSGHTQGIFVGSSTTPNVGGQIGTTVELDGYAVSINSTQNALALSGSNTNGITLSDQTRQLLLVQKNSTFAGTDCTFFYSSALPLYVVSGTAMFRGSTATYLGSDNAPANTLATNTYLSGLTITELGHVATSGTAPTIAAGSGDGTGGSCTISGNDISGYINCTTGTLPSTNATVATVTFNAAYASAPRVVLMLPANAAAAALSGTSQAFINQSGITTTTFAITSGTVALSGSPQWYYQVTQ